MIMDYLEISIVVICVLVIGFIVFPYFKKKGWINQGSLDDAQVLLKIVDLIAKRHIQDADKKSKYVLISELTKDILDYIEKLDDTLDYDQQKELVFKTVYETLDKLKIEIGDDEKQIIEYVILRALKAKFQ